MSHAVLLTHSQLSGVHGAYDSGRISGIFIPNRGDISGGVMALSGQGLLIYTEGES
mgnify:CR=1 FL=1